MAPQHSAQTTWPEARMLRVVLADERSDPTGGLDARLELADCEVVHRSDLASAVSAALGGTTADLVVVDVERPDEAMLAEIQRIDCAHGIPVVVFADHSDPMAIRSAVQAGVAAYEVNGSAPERIRPVLEVAMASFEARRSLKEELQAARTTLAERKVIDRAKGLLMAKREMSEDDAYATMRRLAMSKNMRLHDVAKRLIEMSDLDACAPGRRPSRDSRQPGAGARVAES